MEEVMAKGDYAFLLFFLFVGAANIQTNIGIAVLNLSAGLLLTVIAIFNYKEYANRTMYWIIVFIILCTMFILASFILLWGLIHNIDKFIILFIGNVLALAALIYMAHIKMKKLEKRFNKSSDSINES
ncbi:hypothetical protein [Methanobacterium alcaliphilum]|uniref:hypothetical protein n=1 Tax=Methanobacterium alcaliphilum TaxID=392018 RepID=UPI00200A7B0F|nr:hypothetical protein [Methanobacterium alcaliphilum]MCK9151841.1 hypothetical protein [Methanobacterium alcaliphilum]